MYLDSPDFQLLLENHSVLIFWCLFSSGIHLEEWNQSKQSCISITRYGKSLDQPKNLNWLTHLILSKFVNIFPQLRQLLVYIGTQFFKILICFNVILFFQDFKKTAKLTWIAESAKAPLLPTIAVEFDDVISKPILTKNDDFKNYINKDSKVGNLSTRGKQQFCATIFT